MNTAIAISTIISAIEGNSFFYTVETILEAKEKLREIQKHSELVDGVLKAQAAKYTPKRKEGV